MRSKIKVAHNDAFQFISKPGISPCGSVKTYFFSYKAQQENNEVNYQLSSKYNASSNTIV